MQDSALALQISGLSKAFGPTRALTDVNLDLHIGEVHGLIGENGSGKSTLIKILSGFYVPDAGHLEVGGVPTQLPIPPKRALQSGLSFVHQDLGLIPSLTVLENFRLRRLSLKLLPYIPWRKERRALAQALARYGLDVDPSQTVDELSRTEQTMIAIARAVEDLDESGAEGGRILVLDEPTVSLPASGVRQLLDMIRRIVSMGVSCIFVSHSLDDVRDISDRITVLRNGRVVACRPARELTRAEMTSLMLGRELSSVELTGGGPTSASEDHHSVRIEALTGRKVHNARFLLRGGEILGLTGLLGAGSDELLELIYGMQRAISGVITIDGRTLDLTKVTPRKALAAGIMFVPEARLRDAAVESLTLEENINLPALSDLCRWGWLNRRRAMKQARAAAHEYGVRPPDPRLEIATLSGGNQQKAVLAKWLTRNPRLLLLQEPTQGVDVGSRAEIFRMLRAAAQSGLTAIIASTDLEQLEMICDRVFVMADGRVVGEFAAPDITQTRIAAAVMTSGQSIQATRAHLGRTEAE